MFNIGQMMKQAQAMQEKMGKVQAELETIDVEGNAGGGMVKAIMSAKGVMKSLTIDPSVITPDDKEMLEDLVCAAINDAKGKADALTAEKMSAVTGGLNLPGGMKLPF